MGRSRWQRVAGLLLVLGATACPGATPPRAGPTEDARTFYPGTLRRPIELGPAFAVKQHIRVKFRGREDGFDAVLQKQGDELLVVGLGPMGIRAFTLKQSGDAVSFEQRFGPAFPFPPRNVLVDIHRAFFMEARAPVPAGTSGHVQVVSDQDEERLTETWQAGQLVRKVFQREGKSGDITLVYEGPCQRGACRPTRVVLHNGWYGYELIIENEDFVMLEPQP